ncbi:MAG: hypothetical protein J6T10_11055 [Methanobrevibacter sp.]|nr:hypothetical protein [Methanobrevibacter sp.]
MQITLYKGCRLNKSYCELLDTIAPVTYDSVQYQNALEAYLQSLFKYIVITEENVYATNSGKFSFELDLGQGGTFYEYNYMKVEDTVNNLTRYYFINTITVVNGIAVVEYEEDIWANYSKTMHIRKSLLTRSRSIKYGNYEIPFFKLGMDFEGNDSLFFNPMSSSSSRSNGYGTIVVKMQIYNLVTQDKINQVIPRTVILYEDAQGLDYKSTQFNEKLLEVLSKLKTFQAVKKFNFDSTYATAHNIDTSHDWYYEIEDVILVPIKFGLRIATSGTEYNMGSIEGFTGYKVIDLTRTLYLLQAGTSMAHGQLSTGATFTLFSGTFTASDFKVIGIGTYTNTYEIQQNGTNVDAKIDFQCDDYNFNIFLSVQNQLINITENYAIEIPISVQTADVTQQNRTARQLEIMNSAFQLGKGVLNIYSGSNSITTGAAQVAVGAEGNLGQLASGSANIASGVKEIYGGATTIAKGIANLVVLNKPLYRTNKGTFSRSVGLMNAYYGLFRIEVSTDNINEVQDNINNAGFVVNEIVDDLLHTMATANDKPAYNVMAFGFVNNYGYFPENIRIQLVDILMNGFKIWYDVASYIAS